MFPSVLQFVALYYGILLHRLRRSPLPEGAFDTKKLFANHSFVFCASAKPLWNPATMAEFSAYKKSHIPFFGLWGFLLCFFM